MVKNLSTSSLLLALLVVAGCSSDSTNMADLQVYVNEVVSRPGGNIEPLPEFTSYEAFSYSAAGLRGPFDPPVIVAIRERGEDAELVKPDENREKEVLESFPLASLKMVGSLSRREVLWVLIQDESTAIHTVEVGNYMGRNHGRIIAANNSQIEIIEIVPSGDGNWIERPQTIVLATLTEE